MEKLNPITIKDTPVVIVQQLPDSQKEPFTEYLKGQTTMPVMGGYTGAYYWDYERWFERYKETGESPKVLD